MLPGANLPGRTRWCARVTQYAVPPPDCSECNRTSANSVFLPDSMRTGVINYAEFQTGRQSALGCGGISQLDAGRSVQRLTRKRTMNPKLKSTSRQSRRGSRFGATVKATLDHDLVFVGQPSGREVEAREVAVETLELFMTRDRDFQQWQKLRFGREEWRAGLRATPTHGHAQDRTEGAVGVGESTATARRPSVKYGSPVRLWRGALAAAASTPGTKPRRATRSATSRSFST